MAISRANDREIPFVELARVVNYDESLTMSANSVQSEKTLNKSVYILLRAILKKNNKGRGGGSILDPHRMIAISRKPLKPMIMNK